WWATARPKPVPYRCAIASTPIWASNRWNSLWKTCASLSSRNPRRNNRAIDLKPHHRLHRRGGVHALADSSAQLHFRLHVLLRPHDANSGGTKAGRLAALGPVHYFQDQRGG